MNASELPRRGVIAGAALAATTGAANAAANWLLPWRWQSRLLLLFAPAEDDPSLRSQENTLSTTSAGMAERDLVTIEVIGDHASDSRLNGAALRMAFGIGRDEFRAVLVGKDGTRKLSSETPIPTDRLFATIDAMPMRRGEAARSQKQSAAQ